MKNSKNIESIFIFLEILFGITGGIVYINMPDNTNLSLNDSIINTYLVLNGIFFSVTILFGMVSGFVLKKKKRLVLAILSSLGMGILFLLLHALVLQLPFFAFFSLFGFVIGFNLYLLRQPNVKTNNYDD